MAATQETQEATVKYHQKPADLAELCMQLDKWGEYNCFRTKGHEQNRADHRREIHWSKFNGHVYEWRGNQEAKAVQL